MGVGVALARAARVRLPPRAPRHFGLLADETAANGLERIALGQLDLAIELLRGESSTPPERAVHETRKALKRLRALLRLLGDELDSKRVARERAVLRDAARELAGARDAEVTVGTLDDLLRRHPRKLGRRRGLTELREHLQAECRAATAQTLGDGATRALLADELCALRARVSHWRLPDRSAERLVGAGLERIYRDGRAGHRRAGRRKAGPSALHRWRRHVKDLRYALEILDVGDLSSDGANRRIARLARRADRLGELLGEEHDLMLLGEQVCSHKPLKRRKRTRKRLLRAIARRRASLREQALREGERLFERKPRRFVRRLRV